MLVTTPDEVALVIEAKLTLPNLERSEQQLREYMVGMQCPVGLLITPERMWLDRDFCTARSPQSVQRVGEFDARALWDQQPPTEGALFESFVQRWLEGLPRRPPEELPDAVREPLREYILPAVTGGDIRAAHPRYS